MGESRRTFGGSGQGFGGGAMRGAPERLVLRVEGFRVTGTAPLGAVTARVASTRARVAWCLSRVGHTRPFNSAIRFEIRDDALAHDVRTLRRTTCALASRPSVDPRLASSLDSRGVAGLRLGRSLRGRSRDRLDGSGANAQVVLRSVLTVEGDDLPLLRCARESFGRAVFEPSPQATRVEFRLVRDPPAADAGALDAAG